MTNQIRQNILKQAGRVSLLAAYVIVSACSCLPKGELSLDLGIKDRGRRLLVRRSVSRQAHRQRRGI